MISKNAKCCVLLIFGILFLVSPVFAAINTIRPGEMVFLGEQGLNVNSAMEGDTKIGWWASAASIAGSSPDSTVSVSNPESFSVSPNLFGSYPGVWYHLNPSGQANGTAFNVVDPQLDIKVEDTTVNVDVTDKWVPSGDALRFRIDTNMYPISSRTGGSALPVTIKVQSPDGAIFTTLISNSGGTTSIVDYGVTTSPQYTDSIWGTNNREAYPTGTYTIWAECNVNGMKDNYGVSGKTISRAVSLLNQDQNPLIKVNVPTTNPTQQTVSPTKTVTTLSTTVQQTPQNTSVPTLTQSPVPTATPTIIETTVTSLPTLTPTKTKSAGFEAVLAGFALILALVFCAKKE
ncbi:MAG: hypothetical protein CVV30_09605 [Methanomicrobiales archaeon HGW-Methanomicrobiales-1]|jgi:hypothetical protein|nr:MAG: hypothetical protein CVV30_09605 [Methanomicrobiales archaeon HGW-Methanomicrobiales-1]